MDQLKSITALGIRCKIFISSLFGPCFVLLLQKLCQKECWQSWCFLCTRVRVPLPSLLLFAAWSSCAIFIFLRFFKTNRTKKKKKPRERTNCRVHFVGCGICLTLKERKEKGCQHMANMLTTRVGYTSRVHQ